MDKSFLRRIRSLARTAPLHELEAGKVMRAGDWSAYDLRALCLAAIDTTIEHRPRSTSEWPRQSWKGS